MKLTRKDFLKTSSLIAAGAFFGSNKLITAMSQDKNAGNIKMLNDKIGVYTEKGGTIGFYFSDDALIIIDTQFPDTAKNFNELLKNHTKRKIDYVINTHHHQDHTAGNFYFKDIAGHIVANENSVELQKKFYGKGATADKQAYADLTFAETWNLELPNEKLNVSYYKPAHTGGDSVIHFENENTAHLGDLVFNKVYPYIDRPAGAHLAGWIDYLEKELKEFDEDTLFIFGHAAKPSLVYGNKEAVRNKRDFISSLLDYVQKQISNGKSKEEILASGPIPNFENMEGMWDGALKMNLKGAYEELTS
jgi:glyoxylase-like metal-dependent hydrolase (beta-lactamase superfamily II)